MMQLIKDSLVAYVNLDHRNDRRQHMLNQFDRFPDIFSYSVRVKGMTPEEWPYKAYQMKAMLARPQKGAIGCYLSQEKIMKQALQQNKHAFVMEDDLIFCSDLEKRLEYIDNWRCCNLGEKIEIERKWDAVWLGATFHIGKPWWDEKRKPEEQLGRDAELTDDPRMIRTYGSFCTYAYIVNRNSIQKVLSLLDEFLPQSIGIDHSMINISQKLHTFAFVPGCVKQMDNLSDQIPGSGHITEFSRFSKLNGTEENSAYWYQDRMENFDPEKFDWKEARL
jgi:GR25 family glycosyltransferase involved in LPS biosynthesis